MSRDRLKYGMVLSPSACVQQSLSSHANVKVEVSLLLEFRAALADTATSTVFALHFQVSFTTVKTHSFEKFRA